MTNSTHRQIGRRGDLRWFLVILGFFAYLMLLTWERVEHRERSGRIESLELTLQEKETDEALRRVELKRKTGFIAVQAIAIDLEMTAASNHQCYLLAEYARPVEDEVPASPFHTASQWTTRILRGGIAQAGPSSNGAGDGKGTE